MLKISILLTSLCAVSLASNAQPDIVGEAKITDGDTLIINDIRIRFSGSDAPESSYYGKTQTCNGPQGEWDCGKAATLKLKELINNQEVRCAVKGKDRYKRIIGVCYVGDIDLQSEMVRSGMAVAYLKYSDRYLNEQNEAKAAKAGIWSGEFLEPETWRRNQRD